MRQRSAPLWFIALVACSAGSAQQYDGAAPSIGDGGSAGSTTSGSPVEQSSCENGETQSCFGGDAALADVGACALGTQTCDWHAEGEILMGGWGDCVGWVAPVAEICDNLVDDDCDGDVDEGCAPLDDPCAVGRAAEVGCGRLFVWGDEHVSYQQYWQDQEPFWDNALAWLAQPGSCGPVRTNVHLFGFGAPQPLVDSLTQSGFVVTQASSIPTGTALQSVHILVLNLSDPQNPAVAQELAAWVNAGGALMTMIIGLGMGLPQECANANVLTSPLGIEYSCFDPPPWGPVTSFGNHPIAQNLAPLNAPFENGRFVVETQTLSSTVVASIAGQCPP